MTREEAARILDPATTREALAEIEYYAGFNGREAGIKAVEDACIVAISALRQGDWIPCSDETQSDKKILDVTCGARTMWFNKNHPAAVYCDKRRETHEHLWKNAGNCRLTIEPDIMCDFTQLPFDDNSFSLVVFDPPHLIKAKETSWLVKKYGKLNEMWPQMIHDGFKECMRVLKPDGVLIFKWSECDIPASRVWDAIGEKPLFGHKSGKQSRTFWACFMKLPEPYKGVE